MMPKYLLSLSLLVLSSCSYFVNSFESDILKENKITPVYPTQKTTCDIIQKNILISESQKAQDAFELFLSSVNKQTYLSFIERSILWSFVQMNHRPDLSAPSSKLQVILKMQGETKYYNSYTTNGSGYPFLYLLESLLQESKSKKSLYDLAKIYDQKMPNQIMVNPSFEKFLNSNNKTIQSNRVLKNLFVRGNETLKVGEKLPTLKLTPLISSYYKTKKRYQYKVRNFLFKAQTIPTESLKCNFDMSLYHNSVFLIHPERVSANTWGLKQDDRVFFATSTQTIRKLNPINNSILLAGNSNSRSPSICIKEDSDKNQIWLVSSDSRDPGQHLHHLDQYGFNNIKKLSDLDTVLKFSRHQFFKEPVRLAIESRRSSESQLSELLKLNIPIYNAKTLGKIWGYFESDSQKSFVLDERSPGYLKCNSL